MNGGYKMVQLSSAEAQLSKCLFCRISSHVHFEYLLKTDDDCFLNIKRILEVVGRL